MNLFEIAEAYLLLLDMDLDEEDLKGHLENIEDEFEDKADSVAYVIRTLEGEADTLKKEKDRLDAKEKALRNRVTWLKKSLEESMILMDKRKFKTLKNSFNIQKNRASVKILNEDLIPEDYWKIERKPIRYDIEQGIKTGVIPAEAAELVQTESLRIR